MIPEKLIEVLQHEGVVAIATLDSHGAIHMANTWNSYLHITDEGHLTGPVGSMRTTEANLHHSNKVVITLGSREVQGFHSKGTGFLIHAKMEMEAEGEDYEALKKRFPWARALFRIIPDSIVQTL